MPKMLKRIGTALLFLVVAVCLAPTLVPPFLDHIYYQGPRSDHYDGKRFFNPGAAPSPHGTPQRFLNRLLHDDSKAEWPDHVPVRQTVPPARVACDRMLVTWIGHSTVLVEVDGLIDDVPVDSGC
jgi:hypothetical protein